MKPRLYPLFFIAAFSIATTHSWAADRVKALNTLDLNLSGSWVAGVVPSPADVAVWDSTVNTTNAVLPGADLSWQGIRIADPNGSVTIGTSASTNTLTIGAAGIDISSTVAVAANLTINTPVNLNGAQTWNFSTGRSSTVNGVINGNSASFTKAGAGTVVWNGATNQNIPSITLSGGVLRANDGTSLPSDSALSLAGGVFEIAGGSMTRTIGTGAGQISIVAGTASGFSSNSGTTASAVNLNNGDPTPIVWGSAAFNPSSLILNAGSANNALAFQNPIDLGGGDRTFDVRANTASLPASLSGSGGLIKIGGGTLVLGGTNTFTGNVVASASTGAGTLRAVDGVGLPTTANLLLNNAVLQSSGNLNRALGTGPNQVQLTGGNAGFSAYDAALNVNLGGAGQTLNWGDPTFNPSTLTFNDYGAVLPLTIANGINLGSTYRALDVRSTSGTSVTTLNGVISGSAGFTINGSFGTTNANAVLLLNAVNTFSGRIVIANTTSGANGGRNRIAITDDRNLGAVPTSPYVDNVSMVTGGVLQANESIVLNPNRGIGIGSSAGQAITGHLAAAQGKHFTIPGIVTNRTKNGTGDVPAANIGTLSKIDPGTVFMTNEANTYSGGTILTGGTLEVTRILSGENASSIGNSANAAANLSFNGGRLEYVGTGDTTDRSFTVSGSGSSLESSGSGPLVFSNTTAIPVAGNGARLFTLSGYNTDENIIAGSFANGTPISTTGTLVAASTSITLASAAGITIGQVVVGANIAPNTLVTAVNTTSNVITVSIAPTVAASAVPLDFVTSVSLLKTGSGNWTLSGTNSNTGITKISGGGSLIYDYSANDNASDPLSSTLVQNQAGNVVLRGKSSGPTTETLPSYQLGDSSYGLAKLILNKNGGNGITLNIGTLLGNTGSQRHDLIDLSNGTGTGTGNAVTIGALNANIAVVNGVLLDNGSGTSGRANIVLRDTDGVYSFPTLSAGSSGTVIKATTTPLAPGAAINISNATTYGVVNHLLTAGTYSFSGAANYHTMTFDTTGGDINFSIATKLNVGSTGRGLLFYGPGNVTMSGPSASTDGTSNGPGWFHNYLDNSGTLTVNFPLGTTQTYLFGGTGFSIYSGLGFGNGFVVNGGVLRLTADQDINPLTTEFRLNNSSVLEIGADLNGSAAGDFTKQIGNVAAQANFRFFGDSGLSAWTPIAGGSRVVDFTSAGVSQSLAWGSAFFLTNVDGSTDGDYTLKLSSTRSNANIEIKNAISLNNRNRVIEVAEGSNAIDATLSGIISGPGVGFTKTGPGTLSLTGANTYTGETRIAAGTLKVNAASLAAASRLRIDNGAKLDVTGTVYVNALSFNGVAQPQGTIVNPTYLTGTGTLIVGTPSALPPYDQWVVNNAIPSDKSAPGQDPDLDGLVNLLEYAVGSAPLTANGSVLAKISGTSPTIRFNNVSRTDITLFVESSPDLAAGSWTTIASSVAGAPVNATVANVNVAGLSTGVGQTTVDVTDSRTPATKTFYRLRVTK